MTNPIHIFSEIGNLQTVMLKRPADEVQNFTPQMMQRLLFDDIPYLPIAQKEHDQFAQVLRDNGANVLYLEELVAEVLNGQQPEVKQQFVKTILAESGHTRGAITAALNEFLLNMPTDLMVAKIMAGIRKSELDVGAWSLVRAAEDEDYPYYLDPMPNLYFTRDPSAFIGSGLTINNMTFAARKRESLFTELVINYHPMFAGQNIPVWRDRNQIGRIEGGDELILNDHVVAIGISERTSAEAIEDVARSLFAAGQFDTVLAISIPKTHATMHLDTVFTMVNHDQFTVYPGILDAKGDIDTWVMHPGDDQHDLRVTHRTDLKNVLKEVLNVSELDMIQTGGGDPIIAGREQWNDGSNTLTIAPGVVVTYDRNFVSNQLLIEHGIKVLEVASSELSRGRGGPRCMSCPIARADL